MALFDDGTSTVLLFKNYDVATFVQNDKPRTEAFRKAIFQTVAPGDVVIKLHGKEVSFMKTVEVIDIGAGTGILSMYAAQGDKKNLFWIYMQYDIMQKC